MYVRTAGRKRSIVGFFLRTALTTPYKALSERGYAPNAGVWSNAPTPSLPMRTTVEGDVTPAEITHPLYLVGMLLLRISHALNVQKATPLAISLNVMAVA